MAYTILQNGDKMQNNIKCNLWFAHTQAHQNAPDQTSPDILNLITYLYANDPTA